MYQTFSSTLFHNNFMGVLQRQPCNNLENLHVSFQSSPPLCQDYNTRILSRNSSANKLNKENAMGITLNKKINNQFVEMRKHVIKTI